MSQPLGEVYTQKVESGDENNSLQTPASPDTFEASQALCSDDDDDEDDSETPKKIVKKSAQETAHPPEILQAFCTHAAKCGVHDHYDAGHVHSCWNMPWGKITLTEHDMPRNVVMIKRYLNCFEEHRNFNLHFVLLAFKDFKVSILNPVADSLPHSLILMLLGSPKFFTFRCMTRCDMELLRITIMKYFGIQKTGQDQLTINLTDFHSKMNPQLRLQLQDSIQLAKQKALRKFFNNDELICDTCNSKTPRVSLK